MTITDVKIRKVFEDGPMKAVVSIVLDNEFAIHDIKIIESQDKTFVVMPSRKNANGEFKDIAHPINATSRKNLETVILDAYAATKASGQEL